MSAVAHASRSRAAVLDGMEVIAERRARTDRTPGVDGTPNHFQFCLERLPPSLDPHGRGISHTRSSSACQVRTRTKKVGPPPALDAAPVYLLERRSVYRPRSTPVALPHRNVARCTA